MSGIDKCFQCGGPTHEHAVCPARPQDAGCCCCAYSPRQPMRAPQRVTVVKVRDRWEVVDCELGMTVAVFGSEGEALEHAESPGLVLCSVSWRECKRIRQGVTA